MLSHIRSKISVLFLSLALAVYAQDGNCDYGPDTCINGKFLSPFVCRIVHANSMSFQGYVWREAYVGDVVCVLPATRSQAAADNAVASSRWVNGAYGPKTCINGYVWRQADPTDYVCVLPAVRTQTWDDNAEAPYRVVCDCGAEWETITEQWFGTAPFCNGQCPEGWSQIRSASTANSCDPSQQGICINCVGTSSNSCVIGSKVLCKSDVASISEG